VVKIAKIYYNSPGNDTRTNASLNAEFISVKNVTASSKTLTGWTIKDKAGNTYKFGTFKLGAGKTVIVRTGRGTNSATTRYWQRTNYVWNNDGDTAYLRAASGAVVHSCKYVGKSAGSLLCP
jgi:predicted extracellular nuclease